MAVYDVVRGIGKFLGLTKAQTIARAGDELRAATKTAEELRKAAKVDPRLIPVAERAAEQLAKSAESVDKFTNPSRAFRVARGTAKTVGYVADRPLKAGAAAIGLDSVFNEGRGREYVLGSGQEYVEEKVDAAIDAGLQKLGLRSDPKDPNGNPNGTAIERFLKRNGLHLAGILTLGLSTFFLGGVKRFAAVVAVLALSAGMLSKEFNFQSEGNPTLTAKAEHAKAPASVGALKLPEPALGG